ncbi:hypothetical protein MauCBS54593_001719 [Microsporum audouinii]
MRPKASSSMQKTYDDCHLMCSTAVYFESQNNESEALRAWKSALDAIYYHNAHRVPSTYVPKNDTERSYQDSLRELELQCKERVSLLETLRESRKEAGMDLDTKTTPISKGKLEKSRPQMNGPQRSSSGTAGWIGDGTIPPIGYPELSRPSTLPSRSAMNSQSSLNSITPTPQSSSDVRGLGLDSLPSPPVLPAPSLSRETNRLPPPEKKKTLLTTLRGKDPKTPPSSSTPPRKHSRPVASKAAGLAWSFVTHSSSSKRGQVSPVNESTPSAPRKSTSSDSGSRKDAPPTRHSLEELSTPSRSAYRSDYFSSPPITRRISGDHSAASLAAGAAAAAAAAQRPAEIESCNGFPDSSPDLKGGSFDKLKQPDTKQDTGCNSSHHRPPLSAKPSTVDPPRSTPPSSGTSQIRSNKVPPEDACQRKVVKTNSAPSKPRLNVKDSIRDIEARNDGSPPNGRVRQASTQASAPAQRPIVGRQRTGSRSSKSSAELPAHGESNDADEDKNPSEHEPDYDLVLKKALSNLPKGADKEAAEQIFTEIVVHGDEVHWDDVAGLEPAKNALKEAVVYPFLRPDLFMGLREPARGMLLFGPPGTGKTMLARAVATESKSTFFSVSASSLASKWHGESEKLVRALFGLAKALAPSIIFVDEIDALLSSRSRSSEAEVSRRIKTEFLIQWSDLQRAAAGREQNAKEKRLGDPLRVLVLAATNMPWDIDDAARRRFVRRQYIPLPEFEVRKLQLQKLLSHQKHELSDADIDRLSSITEGFSGSDITALAKDAAMGPLRNLGEDLLHIPMEKIPPISFKDFEASLLSIRPSVSQTGLNRYDEWAKHFGERGG